MKIAGLEIKADRTAYYAFFILMLIPFVVIGLFTAVFNADELGMDTWLNALLVGLCFAAFHEFGQLVHQIGHALAARAAGYPMAGIRYEWAFTFSVYPPNEPPLPDSVHIQRSLGGVAATTILLAVVVLLWLQGGAPETEFIRWLRIFILFDATLLFFAAAVLSDGVLFIRNQDWKNTDQ